MPYSLNPTHPCAPEPLHPQAHSDVKAIADARAFQAWFGHEVDQANAPASGQEKRLSPFEDRRAPALPRPRDFL